MALVGSCEHCVPHPLQTETYFSQEKELRQHILVSRVFFTGYLPLLCASLFTCSSYACSYSIALLIIYVAHLVAYLDNLLYLLSLNFLRKD